MDDEQLEDFKQRLLQYQEQLQKAAEANEDAADTVELDQTRQGRLSRMDALQGQAMSIAAKNRRDQELKPIASALRRIEDSDYGYCHVCDKEISLERLQFNPTVTLCILCAEKLEQK